MIMTYTTALIEDNTKLYNKRVESQVLIKKKRYLQSEIIRLIPFQTQRKALIRLIIFKLNSSTLSKMMMRSLKIKKMMNNSKRSSIMIKVVATLHVVNYGSQV